MRTLIIGALATILVGCSRQQPPLAAVPLCVGIAPCLTAVRVPIEPELSRRNPVTTKRVSTPHKPTRIHVLIAHRTRKNVTPSKVATKAAARIAPVRPRSSQTNLQTTVKTANAAPATINPHLTVASTRTIQQQVAAATAVAEQLSAPDMKSNNRDKPNRATMPATTTAMAASPNKADALVAVLISRPDINSLSELAGKTIAIDDRYSASNRSVRTAIAAAGAIEVQLSQGQTMAINRLVNGEVPAAVLALVSAGAAESFPEIPGFRTFHIPLSPSSLNGQP